MSTNETSLWNMLKHAAYDYQEWIDGTKQSIATGTKHVAYDYQEWIDGAKQDVATGTKRVAYGYQETMDNFTGSLVGNDPQKVDNFDRLAGAGAAFVATLTAPVWVPLALFGCGESSGSMPTIQADAEIDTNDDVTKDEGLTADVLKNEEAGEDTIDTAEDNKVGPELPGEDVLPELPEFPDLKDTSDTYDTAPDTVGPDTVGPDTVGPDTVGPDIKADTAEDVAEDTAGDAANVSDSADVLPWDAADDVAVPQDTVSYDAPSMPLQGVIFAIDPYGDECYLASQALQLDVAACITLLADAEFNASDLFNSANSPIYVEIKKGNNAKEPVAFDKLDKPYIKEYTVLEPFDITESTAIWSIMKYTEYPLDPEVKPKSEQVGKVTTTIENNVNLETNEWYQSYIMYVDGQANLAGTWYKCVWKNPAEETTPTPPTCGEEL